MPTYSPSLRVTLITSGTEAGTWGDTTNENFSYIFDRAIAGYITITAIAADTVLTYNDGPVLDPNFNQAITALLRLDNLTGAAFNIYAPPVSKQYIIWNDGAFPATIYNSNTFGSTTPVGPGVLVAPGDKVVVFSNGAGFYGLVGSKRVVTVASAASVTPNINTTDILQQQNTQPAGVFTINAPSGTPTNGQTFVFRLSSTNVQTFSWNAIYQGSIDSPLPSASSGASKTDYMGFIYNTLNGKWQLLAKNFGF